MIPFSYNTLSANPNFTFIDKMEIRGVMGYLRFHNEEEGLTHSKLVGRHRGLLEEVERGNQRTLEPSDDDWWDEGEQAKLEAEAALIREQLTTTPHDPYLSDVNYNQPCGWLFRKFSDFNNNRNHYVAKTSIKGLFPLPLFGGKVSVREVNNTNRRELRTRYGDDEPDGSYNHYRKVSYNLNLNPARYFRYNGLRRCASNFSTALGIRHDVNGDIVDYNLAEDCGEWSLDGGDNWFGRYEHEDLELGLPHFFSTTFRNYLTQVERGIGQELCRPIPEILGGLDENRRAFFIEEVEVPQKYSLDYCELAWEFATDDPNRIVDELAPIARMYGAREVEENEYRVTGQTNTFSKGVVIRLGAGNQLAFYSKTNRRIRFEYRYRSNRSNTAAPLARKTFNSMPALVQGMEELRGYASEKMEDFFSLVREQRGGDSNDIPQRSLSDLYVRILGATENDIELARLIIEHLATSQSLPRAGGYRNAGMNRSIRQLAEERPDKVIAYHRGSATYRATANYRDAIARAGELIDL